MKMLLAATLALAVISPQVHAEFPTKPVTLVVPFNAGGGVDAIARALARNLATHWGKTVVVENVSGADGLLGTQRVARAAPDGHTVLVTPPGMLLFKHQRLEPAFDAMAVLQPISLVARAPLALSASAKSNIASVADIQRVCAQPKVSCGWGSGESLGWLLGHSLFGPMKLNSLVNVPYRGTGPLVNDLAGSHLELGFTSTLQVEQHHRSGAIRVLAVGGSNRFPKLPGVPTFTEAGVKELPFQVIWFGLVAPKGLPDSVLRAWADTLAAVAKDPALGAVLETVGAEAVMSRPADFVAQLAKDEAFLSRQLAVTPLPQQR
jgi:tripartite-type tricarboxylate transporter receptor subunit TctC